MGYKDNIVVLIFAAVFLFSIIMLMNQGVRTTGYATTATTTSNVTISTYFAIDMSTNLTNGIEFGTINSIPVTNWNATDNNNSVNTTGVGGTYNQSTSMWLNVSTDSNTNVDFCVKADTALTSSGARTIGVGNESYANHTVTNVSLPLVTSAVDLTTGYVKSGFNITVGGNDYLRFWLDVPAATTAAYYNNTLSFEGVTTGAGC